MPFIGEYFREIVAQGIRVADALPVKVLVLGGRLVLVLCRVSDIVGGEPVKAVVFLGVAVQTAFDLEVQVLDDVPGHGAVDSPVPADTFVVVVRH